MIHRFSLATSGQNTAATIFWMKAWAGWREKQELTVRTERPVSQLSDEELERLLRQGLSDYVDDPQERRTAQLRRIERDAQLD